MRRISHFKLGLFILLCAAFGAVAVIWVGATRIFESFDTYAAFFSEPVTGLDSGAPVKHLGVRIGSVDSVDLAAGDRAVRVLVKIKSGFRLDPSMALSLNQAGITGSPFLALEETPASERRTVAHPETKLRVLPTKRGAGGIGGAVQGIENKIASLDLDGLLARWEGVATRVDALLSSNGLQPVVRDLQDTSRSLRIATAALRKQAQAMPPDAAAEIARRIDRTTALGEKTLRDLDESVGASVVLLRQDLAQLRQAVVEAQSLARSLRTEPSQIVERPTGNDPFRR